MNLVFPLMPSIRSRFLKIGLNILFFGIGCFIRLIFLVIENEFDDLRNIIF